MLWKARFGLIPQPAALAAPNGGPPAGWTTTFSQSLTSNTFLGNNINVRQLITAAKFSLGGTKVRVTLQAGSTGGFIIDHAEIGHADPAVNPWNFDGGQVALTFASGNAGVTVTTGTTVLSDEITFTLDITKNFIVAAHFSVATVESKSVVTGTTAYTKAGASEVSTSTVTGYSGAASSVYLVNLIEVFN